MTSSRAIGMAILGLALAGLAGVVALALAPVLFT